MKTNKPPKSIPQPFSRPPHRVSPAKPVAQLKPGFSATTVKRPVAPPVYKPQPRPNSALTKPAAAPPPAPVNRLVQPKMAGGVINRKLPAAPPVYRPQPTPKVLQPKAAPGFQARKPPVAPVVRSQTIQRMEQIPGLPGFYEGELPEKNRGGTFNTVWSQTEPMDEDSSVMSHSSVGMTKRAKEHLVGFALMEHLEEEENTHAEDRLFAYCQQLAIEMSIENRGVVPGRIHLPNFFVSASPCSSTTGTSGKSTGCTENLINWATVGMPVKSEMGCTTYVKVTIGKLTVNKLYKSNSYSGAEGSMAALILLKRRGAIGGWEIEKEPRLDTSRIDNYSRIG